MRYSRFILIVLMVVGVYTIIMVKVDIAFSQTSPNTIFGPKQYDKPKGRPVTYTDTFMTISVMGTYSIWVENGNAGKGGTKNLSVSLNGVEVIDSSDIRANNPATKPVTIQQINTLTVTLKGQGGNFMTVKVLCDGCPITPLIQITSPIDGSTINASNTIVAGTINSSSQEVGITVNGTQAQILGNEFVANDVPMIIGENTITVTATDEHGNTSSDTITVQTDEYLDLVKLSAGTASGLSPLNVDFTIDIQISNPIATYEMDFDGDGVIDQTLTVPDNVSFTYNQEGIFYPILTVTDDQSNQYTATTAVTVLSLSYMDLLLNAKWNNLGSALISENIEEALKVFDENSIEIYREQFTALSSVLNTIGNELGNLRLVSISGNSAEYEIITTRNGTTYSYMLLFVMDSNGLWKIRAF